MLLSFPAISAANGFKAIDCSSSSSRKVFFARDDIDDLSVKIHSSFVDSQLTRAGVFVQNLARAPTRSTKRFSGRFRILCDHPNGFLRPNFFRGNVDLTANLTGDSLREYAVDFTAAVSAKQRHAGSYDCSWTAPEGLAPPDPRTSVDAVLYDDQIECGVGKGNVIGVNISVNVDNGTNLADYKDLVCRLGWAGSGNGRLQLHWRGMDEVVGDVEGTVDHTAEPDGRLRSAIRLETVFVTKVLSFKCVVGEEEPFEGRQPKPCLISFIPIPAVIGGWSRPWGTDTRGGFVGG